MWNYLIALIASAVLFFVPMQPGLSALDQAEKNPKTSSLELPSALAEDDSFDDLPFDQLRQALREEVEYGPKGGVSPRSTKSYNLLIR